MLVLMVDGKMAITTVQISIVMYRFCYNVCWMNDYLGKQAANRNFPEYY